MGFGYLPSNKLVLDFQEIFSTERQHQRSSLTFQDEGITRWNCLGRCKYEGKGLHLDMCVPVSIHIRPLLYVHSPSAPVRSTTLQTKTEALNFPIPKYLGPSALEVPPLTHWRQYHRRVSQKRHTEPSVGRPQNFAWKPQEVSSSLYLACLSIEPGRLLLV